MQSCMSCTAPRQSAHPVPKRDAEASIEKGLGFRVLGLVALCVFWELGLVVRFVLGCFGALVFRHGLNEFGA